MKSTVLALLAMEATALRSRPGMSVPVIQGVSPAIMVLTVAGVMLVTTELPARPRWC